MRRPWILIAIAAGLLSALAAPAGADNVTTCTDRLPVSTPLWIEAGSPYQYEVPEGSWSDSWSATMRIEDVSIASSHLYLDSIVFDDVFLVPTDKVMYEIDISGPDGEVCSTKSFMPYLSLAVVAPSTVPSWVGTSLDRGGSTIISSAFTYAMVRAGLTPASFGTDDDVLAFCRSIFDPRMSPCDFALAAIAEREPSGGSDGSSADQPVLTAVQSSDGMSGAVTAQGLQLCRTMVFRDIPGDAAWWYFGNLSEDAPDGILERLTSDAIRDTHVARAEDGHWRLDLYAAAESYSLGGAAYSAEGEVGWGASMSFPISGPVTISPTIEWYSRWDYVGSAVTISALGIPAGNGSADASYETWLGTRVNATTNSGGKWDDSDADVSTAASVIPGIGGADDLPEESHASNWRKQAQSADVRTGDSLKVFVKGRTAASAQGLGINDTYIVADAAHGDNVEGVGVFYEDQEPLWADPGYLTVASVEIAIIAPADIYWISDHCK